jgi:hypothetical protein
VCVDHTLDSFRLDRHENVRSTPQAKHSRECRIGVSLEPNSKRQVISDCICVLQAASTEPSAEKQMPKHMIISAVLTALLVVTFSTSLSHAESLPNSCIAKPNSDPPPGSHWYYNTDPETDRQCWYLRQDGAKVRLAQEIKRIPLPPPKPRSLAIVDAPIKDASAEAEPESTLTSLLSIPWFDIPTTTGSMSREPGMMSSYSDEDENENVLITKAPREDLPLIQPTIAEASDPAIEPLPVRAVLAVFALALFLSSIVAGLVARLSRSSPALD